MRKIVHLIIGSLIFKDKFLKNFPDSLPDFKKSIKHPKRKIRKKFIYALRKSFKYKKH